MARIAVKYHETYSQVFFVEADSYEKAVEIIENHLYEDSDEYLRHMEMESSGCKNITNENHINMEDRIWNRDLDFKQEEEE